MRAVNLMPGEDRASRAIRSAGSGGIVYVLLGGLAVMVALVALWAISDNQITDRQTTLDRVSAEAEAAEARAADAAPYAAFATLARDRVETIRSLSATRFDWDHSFRELGRVLPADVWLTSLTGSSGATAEEPSPTTSAAPAPTFELAGCTGSQSKVARLMTRLRSVDGVRNVELKTSEKPDSDGDAGGDPDCPTSSSHAPKFTIVITFAVPGATKEKVDATGQVATGSPVVPGAAAPAASPGAPAQPPAPAPAAPATPPASAPKGTPPASTQSAR